jgi:hypothetical protein
MISGKWFHGGGGAGGEFWICSEECSKRVSDRVEMEEHAELVEPTPDAVCTVCGVPEPSSGAGRVARALLDADQAKQARSRQIDTYSAWMDEAGHRFG